MPVWHISTHLLLLALLSALNSMWHWIVDMRCTKTCNQSWWFTDRLDQLIPAWSWQPDTMIGMLMWKC